MVVDKPVTPSSRETRRLATLARDVGTKVVPYQNRRWDGDFRTILHLLAQGALGTLHSFESRYERWRPQLANARTWKNDPEPGAGTGIVFDLGTHVIDQAVSLFGRPEAVYADIATRRPDSRVDDDVFVALLYPGGPRGPPLDECRGARPGSALSPVGERCRLREVGYGRPRGPARRRPLTPRVRGGARSPSRGGVISSRVTSADRYGPCPARTASSMPAWRRSSSMARPRRSTSLTRS